MDDQQRAREQFETWARSKGMPTHRRDYPLSERLGEYGNAYTAKYWEAWQAAITAALRAAPEGFVRVPVEPSLGVLASMAIRRDHGLGCPGYYDAPVFGTENVGHQRRMEAAIGEARQQYAEVVGNGFYSVDREGHYAGLAARPQGVKDAG